MSSLLGGSDERLRSVKIEVPITEGSITIQGERGAGGSVLLDIKQEPCEDSQYTVVDFKVKVTERQFDDLYEAINMLRG